MEWSSLLSFEESESQPTLDGLISPRNRQCAIMNRQCTVVANFNYYYLLSLPMSCSMKLSRDDHEHVLRFRFGVIYKLPPILIIMIYNFPWDMGTVSCDINKKFHFEYHKFANVFLRIRHGEDKKCLFPSIRIICVRLPRHAQHWSTMNT